MPTTALRPLTVTARIAVPAFSPTPPLEAIREHLTAGLSQAARKAGRRLADGPPRFDSEPDDEMRVVYHYATHSAVLRQDGAEYSREPAGRVGAWFRSVDAAHTRSGGYAAQQTITYHLPPALFYAALEDWCCVPTGPVFHRLPGQRLVLDARVEPDAVRVSGQLLDVLVPSEVIALGTDHERVYRQLRLEGVPFDGIREVVDGVLLPVPVA